MPFPMTCGFVGYIADIMFPANSRPGSDYFKSIAFTHLIGMALLTCWLGIAAAFSSTASAAPASYDEACAIMEKRYELTCPEGYDLPQQKRLPFLDKTTDKGGEGFTVVVDYGIFTLGQSSAPNRVPVMVLPDEVAMPWLLFRFQGSYRPHTDLDDYNVNSPIWKKYNGILIRSGDNTCYLNMNVGENNSVGEYCFSTAIFQRWRTMIAGSTHPMDAFDDVALNGLNISEHLNGDVTNVGLHHGEFNRLSLHLSTDGNKRIASIDRSGSISPLLSFSLNIKDSGTYELDLKINDHVEKYHLYVTKNGVNITPFNNEENRFSATNWKRIPPYPTNTLWIYCFGEGAAALGQCGTLAPIVGKFGTLKSTDPKGYFSHQNLIGIPSVVLTYAVPADRDIGAMKAILRDALPDAESNGTPQFYVEWQGPESAGYCNHRSCYPFPGFRVDIPIKHP
ncbi:hypothetical protein VPG91_19975 [Nitrospirillum amazonense]|uniref:hypothetical protein n=1 Tax=Nitrospirillum amazonense TaxID=28077 RepID=UPI002DD44812|nr:hypothetical protein [Nitrospirillum amazonense]MEC4593292.1 hypothetical protein [Nitrospirillum amazonense]